MLASLFTTFALAFHVSGALPTVAAVDLDRYQGTWYEIAALPQSFEEGCVAVQADYTLREDGLVSVVNGCRDGSFDGPWRRAEGLARTLDESNAKLKVRFGNAPAEGDYWILALAPDYSYALVGTSDRKALWILSRARTLDLQKQTELLDQAEALGFPTNEVRPMPQP